MKVLITDKINKKAIEILEGVAKVDYLETKPEEELAKIIGEYDALMIRSQTKVTSKIIEKADNLKIIGRAGVGVDNVNIEAATNKGIIVVNSPEGNTTAAAEHTVAMMMAMARHIPEANFSTKQGKWERSKFTGCELFQKTLGIIGLGKIGSRVAKAALALGMKVIVCDPYTNPEVVENLGATSIKSLDEFWPMCDFITIHAPKTKETAYLINQNTLNRMKKGVRIINCARGGIIDEMALKNAIESGQVAQAAIDVFDGEPISQDNPLLSCEGDLILTPHLGASTQEAQVNVALDVAEQIRDVLSGKNAKSAVNIPSLKAEILEPVKDYMALSEHLGKLISQLSKDVIKSVEIKAKGKLGNLDISPLKVAVLKGLLSPTLEGVNYVNAPVIAKGRGVNVVTSRSEDNCSYSGQITVKVTTINGEHVVSGAMIADKTPRIIRIDQFRTSIAPAEHLLIAPHKDKPGMIAKVATVLGENGVNISMMQVGRKEDIVGGLSAMIINTDESVSDEVLEDVKKVDGVTNAVYINLG